MDNFFTSVSGPRDLSDLKKICVRGRQYKIWLIQILQSIYSIYKILDIENNFKYIRYGVGEDHFPIL